MYFSFCQKSSETILLYKYTLHINQSQLLSAFNQLYENKKIMYCTCNWLVFCLLSLSNLKGQGRLKEIFIKWQIGMIHVHVPCIKIKSTTDCQWHTQRSRLLLIVRVANTKTTLLHKGFKKNKVIGENSWTIPIVRRSLVSWYLVF